MLSPALYSHALARIISPKRGSALDTRSNDFLLLNGWCHVSGKIASGVAVRV